MRNRPSVPLRAPSTVPRMLTVTSAIGWRDARSETEPATDPFCACAPSGTAIASRSDTASCFQALLIVVPPSVELRGLFARLEDVVSQRVPTRSELGSEKPTRTAGDYRIEGHPMEMEYLPTVVPASRRAPTYPR